MKKTIGIFGSAFNPPTRGHADAFMQCLDQVDEIWLVPSYAHAFGKKPLSFDTRCEMLSIFIENFNKEKIKISTIEKEFFTNNNVDYVYTYELLTYLRDKYPNYNFKFICGEDNADPKVWSRFSNYEKIDNEFGKIIAKENVDVRSTYVRDAFRKESYKELSSLLFENVIGFIKNKKLYR